LERKQFGSQEFTRSFSGWCWNYLKETFKSRSNTEDILDLMQDAFLCFMKCKETYEGGGRQLMAVFQKSFRNHCVDFLRRKGVEKRGAKKICNKTAFAELDNRLMDVDQEDTLEFVIEKVKDGRRQGLSREKLRREAERMLFD
jgi:RNA polymerase sigma factor (sigma-70 family)